MEKEIVNQVQEAQRVPYRINPRRNMPRHILIKLTRTKHKERILKAAPCPRSPPPRAPPRLPAPAPAGRLRRLRPVPVPSCSKVEPSGSGPSLTCPQRKCFFLLKGSRNPSPRGPAAPPPRKVLLQEVLGFRRSPGHWNWGVGTGGIRPSPDLPSSGSTQGPFWARNPVLSPSQLCSGLPAYG